MSSLNVLFNLNVTKNLVVLLEKLSKEFQTVDITGEYALFSIRHVIRRFEEMRSQEEFNLIFGEAKKPPGAMESSCEGRQRKIPRWMNDGEMMLTQRLNVSFTTNDANIEQMLTLYHLPPLRVNVDNSTERKWVVLAEAHFVDNSTERKWEACHSKQGTGNQYLVISSLPGLLQKNRTESLLLFNANLQE